MMRESIIARTFDDALLPHMCTFHCLLTFQFTVVYNLLVKLGIAERNYHHMKQEKHFAMQ